jgi:hypothetical protein
MYTLREGCEPPVHGKVTQEDQKHLLYGKYMRYRAAMSAQLVHCPSFKDWLRQEEDSENYY